MANRKIAEYEDPIHEGIILLLEWCLPKDASPAWHTPNGGKRDIRTAVKMKRLGVSPGFPDICFLWRGRLVSIEVKTDVGKMSKDQIKWRETILSQGGIYGVCRSVDQAQQFLYDNGIVTTRRFNTGAKYG